jgi:hypothetical protein
MNVMIIIILYAHLHIQLKKMGQMLYPSVNVSVMVPDDGMIILVVSKAFFILFFYGSKLLLFLKGNFEGEVKLEVGEVKPITEKATTKFNGLKNFNLYFF